MTACTLLFCVSLFASGDPAPDRWFGEDKWKHFFASFVVTSLSASGARLAGMDADGSVAVGAAVGVGVGVWKELRDARLGESASLRDFAWDLAGVGGAAAALSQAR